jgi:hypothetical protein
MKTLIAKLPERFRWTIHNVVAHPLSELLHQLGMKNAGEWLHDVTVPDEAA